MKKLLLLFLLGFAALGLVACSNDEIVLELSSSSLTLNAGDSSSVGFNVTESELLNLQISSSNNEVVTAKIEGNKIVVTGVSAGSAVITIRIKDTDISARLNVSIQAASVGAHFKKHTGIFYVDISGDLETNVKEALRLIEAYDDDESVIANIQINGIENIDISSGAGTQAQLEIVAIKADETELKAVVTIELIGEAVIETLVIYGPEKLTYYIGSVNYDFSSEFTALNLTTKNEVPVVADFLIGEELTFSTPGKHTVTISASDGELRQSRIVELTVKQKVAIPDEIEVGTAANPIQISFGHGNGQDIEALFKKYATAFEAKMLEDGYYVKVSVDKVGSNYDEVRDNITLAMQSNEKLPNIVQNYPDHLVVYNSHSKILSLTPYIFHPVWGLDPETEPWYDIVQSYRDEQRAASVDGDILSMPFNKSTEVVIYNKDVFDEVLKGKAFPETWEDLFALSDAIRGQVDANLARIADAYARAGDSTFTADVQKEAKAQFYPFSYDSSGNAFITLTKTWAGSYTGQGKTKEDKLLFVNDQTKQMLTFIGENRHNLTSPAVWNNASYGTDLFLKGYSVLSVSSSAGADKNTPMRQTSKLFNIGMAPMLYSKYYPESRNAIQQGTNFSITTEGTDAQKIISWLFLRFLNSQEISLDYTFEKGYFPTRYSTIDMPEYQEFLALANNPIVDGMPSSEANKIMRAKAAQIYFLQKDYLVFDLPFKGSSGVRDKVAVVFKDVVLALPTDNIQQKIENALQTAYNESYRLVSDD